MQDDLRERAEEIADFAVGERHDDDMYQSVADIALQELRAAVEAEREVLRQKAKEYPNMTLEDFIRMQEARAAIEARGEPFTLTAEDRRMDGELETEIMRLRAENERLEQEAAAYRARLATADNATRAENERLRATLTIMAEASTDAINRPLRELARAALDERHPQEDRWLTQST